MEIIIVLLIILAAVIVILFALWIHIKKLERQKYYAAAENIIREDFLNYSLQNPMCAENEPAQPKSRRVMLCLKLKSPKQKHQFVFDPEKEILIGRDKYSSNIYINDAFVSQNHCRIYLAGGGVYLLDLNSVNGTTIRRGLFKKYLLRNGYQIELKTGDRIYIGSNVFRVTIFFFDISLM